MKKRILAAVLAALMVSSVSAGAIGIGDGASVDNSGIGDGATLDWYADADGDGLQNINDPDFAAPAGYAWDSTANMWVAVESGIGSGASVGGSVDTGIGDGASVGGSVDTGIGSGASVEGSGDTSIGSGATVDGSGSSIGSGAYYDPWGDNPWEYNGWNHPYYDDPYNCGGFQIPELGYGEATGKESLPNDVSSHAWYAEAVAFTEVYGLINLHSNEFRPEIAMTRQDVAEAIYRMAKIFNKHVYAEGGMALKEMNDYASISSADLDGVSFCYYQGIMTGDGNGNLKPADAISREELAAVLQRFGTYVGMTQNAGGMAIREFTDYSSIQSWATTGISYCLSTGLMKGNANGTFNPNGNVLRCEVAQILYNTALRGMYADLI